jgi:hypothetical protein
LYILAIKQALCIVRPWPNVKPSEKRTFLTLTHFFDAKTQFSGRMDGTIRFALLFCVGIKYYPAILTGALRLSRIFFFWRPKFQFPPLDF